MQMLLEKARFTKAQQAQTADTVAEVEDEERDKARLTAKQRWQLVRMNLGDGGEAFKTPKAPLTVSRPRRLDTVHTAWARRDLTLVITGALWIRRTCHIRKVHCTLHLNLSTTYKALYP